MNKSILMGRLTSDPELRQTQNGTAVARFTIAINRRFQKDETDFINCVVWKNTAEFVCKYFSKGNMIAVVGSVQTRSWEGQDGKKVYATEVVADEVYFTGEKPETKNNSDELPDLGFLDEFADEDDLPFPVE